MCASVAKLLVAREMGTSTGRCVRIGPADSAAGIALAYRRPRPPLQAELSHASPECARPDAEDMGGSSRAIDVPAGPFEHVQDVLTQDVRKPLRRYQAWIGLECQVLREHERTMGAVLQLDQVGGPMVSLGLVPQTRGDQRHPLARFLGRTRNEQGEQLWNVLLPFPQCGHI